MIRNIEYSQYGLAKRIKQVLPGQEVRFFMSEHADKNNIGHYAGCGIDVRNSPKENYENHFEMRCAGFPLYSGPLQVVVTLLILMGYSQESVIEEEK